MDRLYENFENSLLTLGMALGLAAFVAMAGLPRGPASLSITLPMLSVTVPETAPAPGTIAIVH